MEYNLITLKDSFSSNKNYLVKELKYDHSIDLNKVYEFSYYNNMSIDNYIYSIDAINASLETKKSYSFIYNVNVLSDATIPIQNFDISNLSIY